MKELWQSYLDQVLPLDTISQVVVYTDTYRFWLADGLLELAEDLGWSSSLQIIEEITDEEGMEIQQSLGYLSSDTLLAALFSDRNPVIQQLHPIFPLLTTPLNFSGYSITIHPNLPDQYYPVHLQADLFTAAESAEEYRSRFSAGTVLELVGSTTFAEASIRSTAIYPFAQGGRHLLLPGTEVIFDLDPSSVDGVFSVDVAIASYYSQDELLDPFGLVSSPVELLVEKGTITEIRGDQDLVRRLNHLLDLPHTSERVQLSLGLGATAPSSGFVEHDRFLSGNYTLSWIEGDTYLEFILKDMELEGVE